MTTIPLPPDELPTAPFPAPPPFWKHFTTSNQKALEEHPTQTQTQAQEQTDQQSQDRKETQKLPYPLNLLLPPPPPDPTQHTSYSTFHTNHPLRPQPSLPTSNRLLYNPVPPPSTSQIQKLLYTLLKSLLLNYLELLTLMATTPQHHAEKLDDLKMLYENFVGAVNLLRPRQGRDLVRERLETVLKEGQDRVEAMKGLGSEIEEFLGRIEGMEEANEDAMEVERVDDVLESGAKRKAEEMEKMRRLWKDLDDIETRPSYS